MYSLSSRVMSDATGFELTIVLIKVLEIAEICVDRAETPKAPSDWQSLSSRANCEGSEKRFLPSVEMTGQFPSRFCIPLDFAVLKFFFHRSTVARSISSSASSPNVSWSAACSAFRVVPASAGFGRPVESAR
jgi:hypothetical protein